MSLNRFLNNIDIVQSKNRLEGQVLSSEDLETLARDVSIIENLSDFGISIESHIYNLEGFYINSKYNTPYEFSSEYKDFLFNIPKLFDEFNFVNGSYKISFAFLVHLFGNQDTFPLFLEEISPDRTELKLRVKKTYKETFPEVVDELKAFDDKVGALKVADRLNNLVVNFGKNQIFKIVNIKVDCSDELIIYVKLYAPLLSELNEKISAYICFKVLEDYVDTFTLNSISTDPSFNIIGGPNFGVIDEIETSSETEIKYWDSLLDVNVDTKNRLIRDLFSGSSEIPLNIDWTDFSNYIIYGSAEERLKNYKYKLELYEHYDSLKKTVLASNASGSNSIQSLSNVYIGRQHSLLGEFDQFENYLYNHTGSIFTYDITGSVTPNPKYVEDGKRINYPTTSSQFLNWYNGLIEDAISFDRENYNNLFYNTPDHILRDENNSQYVLFLHMIGQHFDSIYAYVNELTSIHRRDEHPERGIPNKLLPYYARSLGWKLQNNKALSDLWLYKLGTNQSGSYSAPTGSLLSRPHEVLSEQVWRRVVNNLPFLLKTKGTERSIRALFSIYGIPFTLISVKEYGGPRVNDDKPNLIQNRFQYLLDFNGLEFIKIPKILTSPSVDDVIQVPQTTEFRFRTAYTGSVSMSLWGVEDSISNNIILQNLEIIPYTSSLYGVNTYGTLRYTIKSGSFGSYSDLVGTSSLLPLLDNDPWTVRIHSKQPVYAGSSFDGNIYVDVGKSSDFVDGGISLSSSFSVLADPSSLLYALGGTISEFVPSASYTNVLSTELNTGLVGGDYGLVIQNRDNSGLVFVPISSQITGSAVTSIYTYPKDGDIFAFLANTFTGSFVSGSEEVIVHNLGHNHIVADVFDDYGYKIIPEVFRIIDENSVGIVLNTTEIGSINISYSGSVGSYESSIETASFTSTLSVTQSNPFEHDTILLQTYNSSGERVIPKELRYDLENSNILIDFNNPETGNIHIAGATVTSLLQQPHQIIIGGVTGSSDRFSGSLQAYKEYFESYPIDVFYDHILNPGAYHGGAYSSSYESLYRYYPLGLDNLKHDHTSYMVVSSSHPKQIRDNFTDATFYNFTGSDSEQYTSLSEIYYAYVPSLGANVPKSRKIRLEESTLVRQLAPDLKAEISRFDTQQDDSNRLAVVFSPTDQINRDIANQFGPYNFENFIGDPEHEGKSYYPDLKTARDTYFKKFSRANDISKYIEIFSLYDYAVFEQIKQLIPGRSNLIAGVLVESPLLERPKIKRTQPSISILDHEGIIDTRPEDPSGNVLGYETVLAPELELEVERSKNSVEINNPLELEIERSKNSVEIDNPLEIEIDRSKNSATITNLVGATFEGSSIVSHNIFGIGIIGEVIVDVNGVCGYIHSGDSFPRTASFSYKIDGETKQITIYDVGYRNYIAEFDCVPKRLYNNNQVLGNQEAWVGEFSSSVTPFTSSQLLSDDYSFGIITIKPNITSSYTLTGTQFSEFLEKYNYTVFDGVTSIYRQINRGKYHSGYHITGSRLNSIYKRVVYHYSSSVEYGSKYDKERSFAVNKSLGLYHSTSLVDANYQHFESSRLGGCRFVGSKLEGAGFGVDSNQTVFGGPVVKITNVDDNQLIV